MFIDIRWISLSALFYKIVGFFHKPT